MTDAKPQWQFGDPPEPGRYLVQTPIQTVVSGWRGRRWICPEPVGDVLAWQPLPEPWEPER